jgi:hypothetical protein
VVLGKFLSISFHIASYDRLPFFFLDCSLIKSADSTIDHMENIWPLPPSPKTTLLDMFSLQHVHKVNLPPVFDSVGKRWQPSEVRDHLAGKLVHYQFSLVATLSKDKASVIVNALPYRVIVMNG